MRKGKPVSHIYETTPNRILLGDPLAPQTHAMRIGAERMCIINMVLRIMNLVLIARCSPSASGAERFIKFLSDLVIGAGTIYAGGPAISRAVYFRLTRSSARPAGRLRLFLAAEVPQERANQVSAPAASLPYTAVALAPEVRILFASS